VLAQGYLWDWLQRKAGWTSADGIHHPSADAFRHRFPFAFFVTIPLGNRGDADGKAWNARPRLALARSLSSSLTASFFKPQRCAKLFASGKDALMVACMA
jgi:hypothetical protein